MFTVCIPDQKHTTRAAMRKLFLDEGESIEVDGETDRKVMFISAASLSQVLEEFRSENEGNFTGIHIKVRKESPDRFAKYVVAPA